MYVVMIGFLHRIYRLVCNVTVTVRLTCEKPKAQRFEQSNSDYTIPDLRPGNAPKQRTWGPKLLIISSWGVVKLSWCLRDTLLPSVTVE